MDLTGGDHPVVELLKREEQILKTLFITPDACLFDKGSPGSGSQFSAWVKARGVMFGIYGELDALGIHVRPALGFSEGISPLQASPEARSLAETPYHESRLFFVFNMFLKASATLSSPSTGQTRERTFLNLSNASNFVISFR
ncbi:hypothetical protein F5879DRAFT_996436 [Lentinula edodes]|nr:hypothetical protein F5879DRAFT_996436 [Lentinula edodes]